LALLFPDQKAFDRKEWCDHTVKQIREWFIREKLLLKDAFKMIDKDGDGFIGERDLSEFLLNKMQFPSK
jgi:Ca2+-binding EF-hand superfamily protein